MNKILKENNRKLRNNLMDYTDNQIVGVLSDKLTNTLIRIINHTIFIQVKNSIESNLNG